MFLLISTASSGRACEHQLKAIRLRNLSHFTVSPVLAFGKGQEAAAGLISTIEGYNRDDCLSTLQLRDWLEDRRRELELQTRTTLPRPAPASGEPSEDLAARLEQVRSIVAR